MKRENFLRCKEYWLGKMQIELYNELLDYMQANNFNQTQLAEKLGVSKSYISQILNGNFDYKFSKLVDLALLMDKAPIINFPQMKNYIKQEEAGIMFPYKHFDYYCTISPPENSIKANSRFTFGIPNAGTQFKTKIDSSQSSFVDVEAEEYGA